MNRDTYFESQFAQTMIDRGFWEPRGGVGFAEDYYGYNPVLHFCIVFLSYATGLSAYQVSKYVLFFVFRFLYVLCAYLIIRVLSKKNISRIVYLSLFLFISSYGMSFIAVSRRSVAVVCMALAVYSFFSGIIM
jgi:hypothetical protein